MVERIPDPIESEDLLFPKGWEDIFDTSDTIEYIAWLDELANQSMQALYEMEAAEDWTRDKGNLIRRWQMATELVAMVTTPSTAIDEQSQLKTIETALNKIKQTLDKRGWEENGLVFTIHSDLFDEDYSIDIRDIPLYEES